MASTLGEAEYFSDQSVTALVYGVGIAPAKLECVAAIRARGIDLAVILDSPEQADAVARWSMKHADPIPALIEIDADGHRSDVPPTDAVRLIAIARALAANGPGFRPGV